MKRLKCGFGPTVEERIVGEGAKGSSGAMWLFGSDGGAQDYISISTKSYDLQLKYLYVTDRRAGLYNHIHKVL